MVRLLFATLVLGSAARLNAAPPAVTAVAYQPDGHRIAFGSHGEVRVYGNGGEATGVLKGQDGRVTAIAYSPSGKLLAVASGSPGKAGVVRLYNSEWFGEAPPANPVATIAGHADIIYTIAFSPDSGTLATAGYDRVIRLWTIPAKFAADSIQITRPRLTLKDHSDTIYSVAFHPDGALLASASADRTVKIWDASTGQRLHTLGEPTDWLYTLQWSPDRKHLAAAGVDKSIRIWSVDRDNAKLEHAVFAHEKPVWRLAYSRDGKTLYSTGEDRIVKAWNAARMVETKVYAAMPEAILDFALHPDGKSFAVGRFDGIGATFDAASGKPMVQMLPVPSGPPKPAKITPAAVARGSTTRVTIAGSELGHVRKVTSNQPGVSVQVRTIDANALGADIVVKPEVPAGAVQLVLENEAGKSGPLNLAIDRYAAIAEAGISESARAAQPVKLPVTIAGSIDRAGDVDYYRFDAKAGDPIGVQVVAAELGSKLDPLLSLTDAEGRILAEGTITLGFTIARDGSYSIGVRDRDYRGAGDMTYRLHIGDIPVITGVFPLGAQRGKTATVHLEGVNLGAARQAVTVSVPMEAAPGSRIPVPLPRSGETPLGNASILVDEFASHVVDPAAGMEIRVPGSADGILLKPNDAQTVRFTAKKGERLIVEVTARRAGSPVDPVLEILDSAGKPVPRTVLRSTARLYSTFRDHDAASPGIRLESWNEIGIDNYLYADGELMRVLALPKGPDDDCQFYQAGGQRLGFLDTTPNAHAQGCPMYKVEQHPPGSTFPPNGLPVFTLFYRNDDGGAGYGKDSRVFFEAPAEGLYQARISDARGAGGPTHAYRLTVRPPRPDFTVSFTPTAPAVWKGGAAPIGVKVERIDGFEGPIRVKLGGLPPGFSAPEAIIDAGQLSTSIALFAEVTAAVTAKSSIKLTATAVIGGPQVVHDAAGGTPTLRDPGDIVATARQASVKVKPGQETRLVVDVERRGDFKGRVPIEVRGLPHGVRVLNIGLNGILITERDASREIVIYAEPWVQPMAVPFVVLAKSERKGTEHAARAVILNVEK
jgi:WD40 repeat protein